MLNSAPRNQDKSSPKNEQPLDYLTLNTILNQIIAFAATNQYQSPRPLEQNIATFDKAMQALFILYEQVTILPSMAPKATLEEISNLYSDTARGLNSLYMCSPEPKEAKGWFDYQKEYHSREEQQRNLLILLEWHRNFYQKVLSIAPTLPIPVPDGFETSVKRSAHKTPISEEIKEVQSEPSALPNLAI